MSWLQQEDDTTPCSKVRRNRAKITARSLPNWILLKPDSVHLLSNKSVVGYSTTGLKNGFTAAGGQFVAVSGEGLNIQDIKVVGYEGETAGDVDIQILDRLGRMSEQYFWVDLPDDDIYGWLDGDDEMAEIEINPGAGLWINAPSAEFSIVIPGVTL